MRGWLVGLVIGLVVGAGAMYLVLRPPWGGGAIVASDAGVVAQAPVDAGVAKKKLKQQPHHRSGGRTTAGPDFEPGGTDETDERPAPAIVLTAADRVLEWRGDSTSIARKIDLNAPGDARPLDNGEINATVPSQSGGVRSCVEKLAAGADLRATITIKIVVDGTGKVTKSQLQAPHYLFEKGLLNCAQRALGTMHFPATGAPTLVTFPVELT